MNDRSWQLRRLTVMAMLVALSFISVAFIRIPVVEFLKYEPKDVFLTIAGFLYGPVYGAVSAVAVAFVEFITISDTGAIGLAMNILSSCLFVCTASFIYHRKRTLTGAVAGLVLGAVLMTGGMVLWNYLITPVYMNVPRAAVAEMLLPVFAPFNLLKGGINASLTMMLYKSVSSALRSAKLLPPTETTKNKSRFPIWVVALFLVISLVLVMLVWNGVI